MTTQAQSGSPTDLTIEGLAAPRLEPARDGQAPDHQALDQILQTAITVPDHGGLQPWRFAVVTGAGQARLGEALVAGLHALRGDDLPEAMVSKMRGKAFAAPCAVVVIASPDPSSNVPIWEQVASASCTGYALVLAATAVGYAGIWKSAQVLDTDPVRSFFNLTEHEQLLGWVNIGTPGDPGRRERASERAGLDQLVTVVGDDDRPWSQAGIDWGQ
jgi:nitroreductase